MSINQQGLVDLLEAAVTGLLPKQPYLLALVTRADGTGPLEPLSQFTTNPAGAAVVIAVAPLRKVVKANAASQRRYLVTTPLENGRAGAPVQIQR